MFSYYNGAATRGRPYRATETAGFTTVLEPVSKGGLVVLKER